MKNKNKNLPWFILGKFNQWDEMVFYLMPFTDETHESFSLVADSIVLILLLNNYNYCFYKKKKKIEFETFK